MMWTYQVTRAGKQKLIGGKAQWPALVGALVDVGLYRITAAQYEQPVFAMRRRQTGLPALTGLQVRKRTQCFTGV